MLNGKQYYGGYFWVAVVSFIVPLFVGWKAFDTLKPTSKPPIQVDASGVDHNIWNYLLQNYVANGLVDYDGMKRDYLFHKYIAQLGACNPEALQSKDDKLALHCNAYNAFVINGVISNEIDDQAYGFEIDGVDFFDLEQHYFANQTISLNHLEHQVIRPVFRDPRIHVALVCAAKSCPPLRSEAFFGNRINEQFNDLSKSFANNKTYVSFEKKEETGDVAQDADAKLQQLQAELNLNNDQMDKLRGDYLKYLNASEAAQKQLDEAIRSKLGPNQVAIFSPEKSKLVLSPILSWYGGDWGPNYAYLPWLEGLADDEEIKQAIADVRQGKIGIKFAEYDWALNSQAKPKTTVKAKGGGFGSGSSPDE